MLKNSLVGAIELLVGYNSSVVFEVYMTDPVVTLTAGAIASLAFQAFSWCRRTSQRVYGSGHRKDEGATRTDPTKASGQS
jgi:hypothetical protein